MNDGHCGGVGARAVVVMVVAAGGKTTLQPANISNNNVFDKCFTLLYALRVVSKNRQWSCGQNGARGE